jgi:hypothetical protein
MIFSIRRFRPRFAVTPIDTPTYRTTAQHARVIIDIHYLLMKRWIFLFAIDTLFYFIIVFHRAIFISHAGIIFPSVAIIDADIFATVVALTFFCLHEKTVNTPRHYHHMPFAACL